MKSDKKNTEALEASYTNCFVYPFLLTLIEFSYTKYNYEVVNLEAFKRLFKWILIILNNLRNIDWLIDDDDELMLNVLRCHLTY